MTSHSRVDSERVLLADVGGTNVRFAILDGVTRGPIASKAVRGYAHFADALEAFIAEQIEGGAICAAIIAVAGVVERDRCALTNSPWVVDAVELRTRFGLTDISIINDVEAIAWALPHLARDDLVQIGGEGSVPGTPMIVLGSGTGFGVAVLLPSGRGVLRSEAGHTTLPVASEQEDAIVRKLRGRFGHVSVERVLSGPGLENMHQAIAEIHSATAPRHTATEITHLANEVPCTVCRATVDTFCAMLGEVAGNLALNFCAQGGVYIAGPITCHLSDYLPQSQLRSRFDEKGRLISYIKAIPAFVIVRENPAFIGLQWLAVNRSKLPSWPSPGE